MKVISKKQKLEIYQLALETLTRDYESGFYGVGICYHLLNAFMHCVGKQPDIYRDEFWQSNFHEFKVLVPNKLYGVGFWFRNTKCGHKKRIALLTNLIKTLQ